MIDVQKCIQQFQRINEISLKDLHLNLKNYEASNESFHKILFDSSQQNAINDFRPTYEAFMSQESSAEMKEQYAIQAYALIRLIIEKADISDDERKNMLGKIHEFATIGPEESAEAEHYQAMEAYYGEVQRLQHNLKKLIHQSCSKEIIVAFDMYVKEVGVHDDITGI